MCLYAYSEVKNAAVLMTLCQIWMQDPCQRLQFNLAEVGQEVVKALEGQQSITEHKSNPRQMLMSFSWYFYDMMHMTKLI